MDIFELGSDFIDISGLNTYTESSEEIKKRLDLITLEPDETDTQITFLLNENSFPAKTFELETNDDDDDEDKICVKECTTGSNIVEDSENHFIVDNLLSELKTEYQKLIARLNLGIGDEYTLKWGNIIGSLGDQSDLINYLSEQYEVLESKFNTYINNKIDAIDINDLDTKTTLYYGPDLSNLTLSSRKTFTTGDYEYIYVLILDKDSDLSVNGLKGGFTYLNQTRLIDGTTFYVFKSDNSNLGITTITYELNK